MHDDVNVQWAVYGLSPTQTFASGGQDYRQAIRQSWQQFKRLCAAHPEMESVPDQTPKYLGEPYDHRSAAGLRFALKRPSTVP